MKSEPDVVVQGNTLSTGEGNAERLLRILSQPVLHSVVFQVSPDTDETLSQKKLKS